MSIKCSKCTTNAEFFFHIEFGFTVDCKPITYTFCTKHLKEKEAIMITNNHWKSFDISPIITNNKEKDINLF